MGSNSSVVSEPILSGNAMQDYRTLLSLLQIILEWIPKALVDIIYAYVIPNWVFGSETNSILSGHEHDVTGLCLLETDDKENPLLASSSNDHSIRIWNLRTRRCIKILEDHQSLVNVLLYLPKRQLLLSGSSDCTIKLWNLKKNNFVCVNTLQAHQRLVSTLCLIDSENRFFASGSYDNTILVWDLQNDIYHSFEGHTRGIHTIIRGRQKNTILSGSMDKTIRIWDLETNLCKKILEGHASWVNTLLLSWNDLLISGSNDATIKIWNLDTFECLMTLSAHTSAIISMSLLPDGKIASGSKDETVKFWSLKDYKCLYTMRARVPVSMGVLTDGSLAIGSNKTISIYNFVQ